jgi:predicted Zn-dependent protease
VSSRGGLIAFWLLQPFGGIGNSQSLLDQGCSVPAFENRPDAAVEESPDDVNLRATNAIRLQLQPARGAALRELNAILAQHPEHAFSREARAKLSLSMRRAKGAVADLDVLLADDNPKTILWSLRATAYLQTNEPQRAIADFTKAMEDHPGQLDLLSGRVAAYELVVSQFEFSFL